MTSSFSGKLFCPWQILTLGVRRLGTQPPNFPLNIFVFLSFFFLSLSTLPSSSLTKTWKSFMKSGWGFFHPEVDIWVGPSEEGLQFDAPHLPSRELRQSESEDLTAGTSCGLMFGCNQTSLLKHRLQSQFCKSPSANRCSAERQEYCHRARDTVRPVFGTNWHSSLFS